MVLSVREAKMSLAPLGTDDFNHAKWLDLRFAFSERFRPFVMTTAARMLKGDKAARADVHRNNQKAISVILANIIRNNSIDRSIYTIIRRKNASYPENELINPLNLQIRSVARVLDYFISEEVGYLSERGGNFDSISNLGYTSRYRARDNLFKDIIDYEKYLLNKESNGNSLESGTYPIIGNTLDTNPNSIKARTIYNSLPKPLIRLRSSKSEGKKLIPFVHNQETEQMEAKLKRYNDFLDDHWIDLAQTDEQIRKGGTDSSGLEATAEEDQTYGSPDLLFSNHLHRVFNEGSFQHGGRFYGGWWQTIPSQLRKWVTIDWHPTAELDYSNMQIVMLYARAGAKLTGDAYEIEGIPNNYRPLLKTTLLQVINAKGRMRRPNKADLPEGWTWEEILDAVKKRHEPIAKFFTTGIGLELQRTDSDIAEHVMLDLMEQGIVALPVHDSFIVPLGKEDALKTAMLKAFEVHAGAEIKVDADQSWLDDLIAENPDVIELDDLDVRHISDFWQDHFDAPGFEKFKQRQSDFLAFKGEAWGHSHSFVLL